MGVRIFQEMTDAKTKAPKNANRRLKRSMRRNLERFRMRKKTLENLLVRS